MRPGWVKLFGGLLLALGLFALWAGASLLTGGAGLPDGGGSSCKAICGWTLLVRELVGNAAGSLVGGLLWLVAGAAVSLFGYRVLKG